MNRYSAMFILYLLLWLVLALTPAACAIFQDGDHPGILGSLRGLF